MALQRNRDVIAAQMEIEAAELDVVAARVYPNPTFAVRHREPGARARQPAGGRGRPRWILRTAGPVASASARSSTSGRSAARARAGRGQGRRSPPLLTEDALREIVSAVRSAFAEAVREQVERHMAHDFADRYAADDPALAGPLQGGRHLGGGAAQDRARGAALPERRHRRGDAARLSRGKLAALLGLPSARRCRRRSRSRGGGPAALRSAAADRGALERRPDLRAAGAARVAGGCASSPRPSATRCPTSPSAALHAQRLHHLGRQPEHAGADAVACRCRCSTATRPTSGARSSICGAPTTTASGCASRRRATWPRRCAGGRARRRCWRCSNGRRAATCRHADRRRPTRAACWRAPRPRCASPRSPTGPARSRCIELLEAQRTYLDTRAQYLRARLRLPPGNDRRRPRRRRAMTPSRSILLVRPGGGVAAGRRRSEGPTARPRAAPRAEKPRDFIRYDPGTRRSTSSRSRPCRSRAGRRRASGAGLASTRTTRSGSPRPSTAAPSRSW